VFAIDVSDPMPLYAQLERAIRVAIATGRLRPGDKLPTVRKLAVDLRINANTVAKVYGELERTGELATRRGVGTFIEDLNRRSAPLADRQQQLAALTDRFLAEAGALGFSAEQAVSFLKTRGMDCQKKQEKSHA
jgi:GntR family transcriptional regulator